MIRNSIRSSNAAASYGEPPSASDLAERILNRVRTENRETSARRWLPWAVAFPLVACLITLFMLVDPKPKQTPANQSEQSHISAQPTKSVNSTTPSSPLETAQDSRRESSHSRVVTRHIAVATKTHTLPKLDTFPAQRVLTPEEQALATYAADAPVEEQRALVEAHDKLEAPLAIAAITIQPLEPPGPGGN